jgi:hypothetical protein
MTADATKLDAIRKLYREGAQTQRSMMQAGRAQRAAPGQPALGARQTGHPAASSVTPAPFAAVPEREFVPTLPVDQSPGGTDPKLGELESFLAAVLAPDGPVYFAVTLRRVGTKTHAVHHTCRSIPELAQRVLELDTGAHEVYFAAASYLQEAAMIRGVRKQRCQENVAAVRACWLDVDVSDAEAGNGYATQAEARVALDAFCAQLSIPPTFINSSGNGLHVYWTFSEPIAPARWQSVANALKRACRFAALLADPTCTADSARMLRAPGTFNRKYPTAPRPVATLARGEPVDFEQFRAAVGRLAGSIAAAPAETPGAPGTDADALPMRRPVEPIDNSDLSAGLHEPHPYLRGLTREEGLTLIDTACAAIPDSEWAKYVVWAETAMPGLRGLHWEDEAPLLDILSRHTHERDRPALAEKFYSWDGGSIAPLFELAERHGWRAAGALPAPTAEAAAPAVPFENEPALERYLTGTYVLVRSRGEGEYFDVRRHMCLRPGAVNRAEGHLTRVVGKSADKILRGSPLTPRVDFLGFHPAEGSTYKEDEFTFANLHYPTARELQPTDAELRLIADFLNYLFPRPEDQAFKLFYQQFLAHIVRRPSVKIATALLFVGGFGVGKNTAAYDIPSIIVGCKNAQVISNKVLNSAFSDQLGKAHLVYLDEVHCNGSWQSQDQANNLKSLVSDRRLVVHPKGHAAYDISNRVVVTATSNYDDAMFLQTNDRRWAVHEVKPVRACTPEQHRRYFNVLHRFLGSPRAPGVLRWIFGHVNLAGFDAQNPPPMTAAKTRMVESSRSPLEDEVVALFEDREAPFNRDLFTLEDLRFALRLRMPRFADTSRKRLATIVKAEPIHAEKLTVRPRSTDARGKSIRPNYWALRNADAWSDASNEDILRHLKTGAPLLRAVPEAQADGDAASTDPAASIAQPAEKVSTELPAEPARGTA